MGKVRGHKQTVWCVTAAAVATFGVLLVAALAVFGIVAARNIPLSVREAFTMRVELADSLSPADIEDLSAQLILTGGVKGISVQRRGERSSATADSADLSDIAANNPLPDILVLSFRPDYVTPQNLRRFQSKAEADARVKAAVLAPEMAEIATRALPAANMVSGALLVAICLLAYFAVWHGARLVRRVRKDYEDNVSKTGENRHIQPWRYYAAAIGASLAATAFILYLPAFTQALYGQPPVVAARMAAMVSTVAIGFPAVVFGLGRKARKKASYFDEKASIGSDFVEEV